MIFWKCDYFDYDTVIENSPYTIHYCTRTGKPVELTDCSMCDIYTSNHGTFQKKVQKDLERLGF